MRIKIDGKDIDRGSRVTFESSDYSDGQAYIVILIGAALIYSIIKGGLFT